MLALELEFLTGAYRASLPDGSDAEWPPHPERLFSALVQAWGDGGRVDEERAALEWLEALPPPRIEASADAFRRDVATVYVPPNDMKGGDPVVLPGLRRRQARSFRAAIPTEPLVRFYWDETPEPAIEGAIDAMVARVASVGHSTSLVRCARIRAGRPRAAVWKPMGDGSVGLRAIYPGRLADLERWFSTEGGKGVERPRTKRIVPYGLQETEPHATPHSVFGGPQDWFIFEDLGDFRPDLLAFGIVAKRIRDALMSLAPQPPVEPLSGHGADGRPTRAPHVAFVPLANVGGRHATGDLLGFAAVLPRGLEGDARRDVLTAIARFARMDSDGEAVAELHLTERQRWLVSRAPAPSRFSLKPWRYCQAARSWATVTPLLLDRFPDKANPEEEAAIVAAACRNIGLPEPVEIEFYKHSPFQGAPPAYGRRGQLDWNMPRGASFASRPRRHVVLRFGERVRGPVLLGAGRFYGFGLCLPIPEDREDSP